MFRPLIITMLPGTIPGCPVAALTGGLIAGPIGSTVRLKVVLSVPAVAVTVTGPGVGPAVTVTDVWPVWSEVVDADDTVAEPLTVQFTATPPEGALFASVNRTTNGEANAWLTIALWPPPETGAICVDGLPVMVSVNVA